ncbi:hypothetical protein V5O48_016849 [Marasmius crinis-equi]|uniref:Uncharacterized protein n=1 Tax=Marasmius crinis-equi TaxID=585013 RepID=A0ABR3EQK4_9AGAR
MLSPNFEAATTATSTSSAMETTTLPATPPTESSPKPVAIHSTPISTTSTCHTLNPSEQAAPPTQTESDCMWTHIDINQIASMAFGSVASVSNDESFYFSAPAVSSTTNGLDGSFDNSRSFETSCATFANGSNAISPHLTGTRSSDFYHPRAPSPSLPYGVLTSSNDQPAHLSGASAAAYTTPIYSHTSLASFNSSLGVTYPNAATAWNPHLPSSSLPYSQAITLPPILPLQQTVYSLPSLSSHLSTFEELRGWNTTIAPSLKRKERDTFDFDGAVGSDAKRTRISGPGGSDANPHLWPAQEAECGASSSSLERGVARGIRGMQTYESSERVGRLVGQTQESEDENRRLREENERLRRILGMSGLNGAV